MKLCSTCNILRCISQFSKQRDKPDGHSAQCKLCIKKRRAKYFTNPEVRHKINVRRRKRRATNPIARISGNLRTRIWYAVKGRNYKNATTEAMLGCSFEQLKEHLEKQFVDGMSWDNYGEWHIDHIKPLTLANSTDMLTQLCHYSNLQPLWALENASKGGRINL